MTIQKNLIVFLIIALIVIANVDQATAKKGKGKGNGSSGNGPEGFLTGDSLSDGGQSGTGSGNGNGTGAVPGSPSSIIQVTGSGADVKAAAELICTTSQSLEEVKKIARIAENVEKQFNEQIKSGDKELVKVLKCQKLKNKILKNTCQLVAGTIANKQDQIDTNTKQVGNNLVSHDSLCKKVDSSQFVDGSSFDYTNATGSGKGKGGSSGRKGKGNNKK